MSPLLQYFRYDHLPAKLQDVSRPFHDLAKGLMMVVPNNVEREAALRKLLEAKDCAVRATIYREPE